jgi:hypothetical protein
MLGIQNGGQSSDTPYAMAKQRHQVSFDLSAEEFRLLRAIQVLDGSAGSPSGKARNIVREHLVGRASEDRVQRQLDLLPHEE